MMPAPAKDTRTATLHVLPIRPRRKPWLRRAAAHVRANMPMWYVGATATISVALQLGVGHGLHRLLFG